jgi:hypothetical protein
MGKLSDEQAAQLAELQALAEAPDDPELELYVKDENGRETRLTGSHAQKWLKNLGLGDDDATDAGAAGDGAGDDKGDGAGDGGEGKGKQPPRWFR